MGVHLRTMKPSLMIIMMIKQYLVPGAREPDRPGITVSIQLVQQHVLK